MVPKFLSFIRDESMDFLVHNLDNFQSSYESICIFRLTVLPNTEVFHLVYTLYIKVPLIEEEFLDYRVTTGIIYDVSAEVQSER